MLRLLKRPLKWAALLFGMGCIAWFCCRPVVVLHYAAEAKEPVTYFFDEPEHVTKDQLMPGQVEKFRMPMFPDHDATIFVSAPFASRDGVEIKPPWSRVDIYIDAQTRFRMEVKHGFLERF